MTIFGSKLLINNVDVVSYLRSQHHALKIAAAPLNCPDVQLESVSYLTTVDVVKFVHGSSLKTAARQSHVTAQRDWSATLVVDMDLRGESVEVQ